MGERKDPFVNRITMKEETEKGDIAKSLQQLIETQYISKRFFDIVSSTRLTKQEAILLSIMEIRRISDKIFSLTEKDVTAEGLSDKERNEIKELYELKKRFYRNPLALSYMMRDSFMYFLTLSYQSLDGGSRSEGVTIAGGGTRKILDEDKMGGFDKIRHRLFGKVLYEE